MNPSFFGLEGDPFDGAAASRDGEGGEAALEASLLDAHESLVTELSAGLKAPHGITLVIGEAGAGKSALLRAFTTRLADASAVAFLPSTGPGLRHLLTEAIGQLGLSTPASDEESALVETLRAAAARRGTTIIVVDDAHELPAKTIERLGKLFGDDAAEPSGLHVILVGRPELLDRMNAANDRSILKHLVQVCRMDPIGPEEALRYISERLARVGGLIDNVFTRDAVRLIVNRAGGNPQRIDELCAAAMEQAEITGACPAGPDVVDRACAPETGSNGSGYSLDPQAADSGSTGTGGYVFDEPDDDGGGDVAGPPPSRKMNRPRRGPVKSKSSGILARLSGTRRSLVLAAVGLVAVLGFFAATMTDTGPGAISRPPVAPAVSKVASAPKVAATKTAKPPAPTAAAAGRREARSDAPAATKGRVETVRKDRARAAAPTGEVALPAKPVSTPKLVVKRTPPPADAAPSAAVVAPRPTPTPPPARAPVAPVHAAGRTKPAPATAPAAPAQVAAVAKPAIAPAAAAAAATGAATPAAAATRAPIVVMPSAPQPAAPAAASPPPQVASSPRPAAAVVAPGQGYTVQVGAFSRRDNAQKMLTRLQGKYSDGRIVDAASSGSTVYRVLSGLFASKADADRRAAELARSGFSTYVRRAR